MKELFLVAALSLSPVSFKKPAHTEADEAFYRFLRECMPSPGKDDIVMVFDPLDWDELFHAMRKLMPGGFIFVENSDPQVYRIMKNWKFQRLPFLWRQFEVYRKPLGAAS